MLAGSRDNQIYLYNVNKGKLLDTFYGHSDEINGCSFTPNGKKMVSIGNDAKLCIWKVGRAKPHL